MCNKLIKVSIVEDTVPSTFVCFEHELIQISSDFHLFMIIHLTDASDVELTAYPLENLFLLIFA